jgi:hypothetical protein
MGKYAKPKRKRMALEWLAVVLAVILILLLTISVLLELMTDRSEPTLPQVQTTPIEATGETTLQKADTTPAESSGTESTAPPAMQETLPQQATVQLPIALQEGLVITDIGKYAGIYMEDGSDETVSNILMIQLENTTEKDLYLAQIKLEYGNKTAVFQVTNLPKGAKAILLEQQRMSYTEQLPQSASAENVVFTTEFSMFADQLEVTALNGVINVKNISGKDIPEDIYVYYKNYAGNMYYGGITYRIRIEGGLKAGDIRQVMASRFNQSSSRLMMVTIGG